MESNYERQRRWMVNQLLEEGVIKSKKVERAFTSVPREEFVWPDTKSSAYHDTPLPLGDTGQTISAPHMVAIMLEELELDEGQFVLEVGAGSGYSAALMAEIVCPTEERERCSGRVVSVERLERLVEFARENLARAGYADRVAIVLGDGTLGYPEGSEEPVYDRIVVTAAAPYVPKYLKAQLKTGGILLIPVGDLYVQTLMKLTKGEDGTLTSRSICSCMFVPLFGRDGHK